MESCAVRKNNLTAVGNPSRIDRAMSLLQTLAGRRFMLPRISIRATPAVRPIDGDSSEQRIVAIVTMSRADGTKQKKQNEAFHITFERAIAEMNRVGDEAPFFPNRIPVVRPHEHAVSLLASLPCSASFYRLAAPWLFRRR